MYFCKKASQTPPTEHRGNSGAGMTVWGKFLSFMASSML